MNTSAPPTFARTQISLEHHTESNPINIFIIKFRKQTGWLRSWTDGNWGSSPSSYLPCCHCHSSTGLLVRRSCTSSGGARSPSQSSALLSPHSISGIQQQLPRALVDGHLPYTTEVLQCFLPNTARKQVGFAFWPNMHKKFPINGWWLGNKLGCKSSKM